MASEAPQGGEGSNSFMSFIPVPMAIATWLRKRGKAVRPELTKQQRAELRECFNLIDADGSGAIGSDEMADAFKFMGIQVSKKDMTDMLAEVDRDGSGEVEYEEFVEIMTSSLEKVSVMQQERKTQRENESKAAGKEPEPKGSAAPLPFPLLATAYRRRKLLEAMFSGDKAVRARMTEQANRAMEEAEKFKAEETALKKKRQEAKQAARAKQAELPPGMAPPPAATPPPKGTQPARPPPWGPGSGRPTPQQRRALSGRTRSSHSPHPGDTASHHRGSAAIRQFRTPEPLGIANWADMPPSASVPSHRPEAGMGAWRRNRAVAAVHNSRIQSASPGPRSLHASPKAMPLAMRQYATLRSSSGSARDGLNPLSLPPPPPLLLHPSTLDASGTGHGVERGRLLFPERSDPTVGERSDLGGMAEPVGRDQEEEEGTSLAVVGVLTHQGGVNSEIHKMEQKATGSPTINKPPKSWSQRLPDPADFTIAPSRDMIPPTREDSHGNKTFETIFMTPDTKPQFYLPLRTQ